SMSPVTIVPTQDDPAPAESVVEPDDPRVLAALEEYMAALETGRPLRRGDFLERHGPIAAALKEAMEGLEFIKEVRTHLADQDGCDETSASEGELADGQPLGDFRIVRQIGRGGMGVVYEAQQLSLGRRVALKVLPFAAALDTKHLQRFRHEAQAAASLHHQNIVPVYGVGCERGVHYYAMQFIDGRTLAAVVAELRRLAGLEAGAAGGATAPAPPAPPPPGGTPPPAAPPPHRAPPPP